ncbi:MAG: GNAT family N-acetyltransferase [Bacteroidales bacterium]|nr:GNAT family N-acetyltransferase [Bacteroidales bacterium]
MIQKYEQLTMNAWPAFETIHYDGWVLRFADGVNRRSNSINPLNTSQLDIHEKIDYCEKVYHTKNIPVCFKINAKTQPGDIDTILESLGYTKSSIASAQVIDLEKFDVKIDENVDIQDNVDDIWMERNVEMFGMAPSDKSVLRKIIDKISLPKCVLTVKQESKIIGCGLGVLEDKYIGLFDIAVDSQYRNNGFGLLIVTNLLKWGRIRAAEFGYLQVFTNNASAVRLYKKIGFKEEYRYWYRIKESI